MPDADRDQCVSAASRSEGTRMTGVAELTVAQDAVWADGERVQALEIPWRLEQGLHRHRAFALGTRRG